jgi:SAM-dependent methyltransferase
MTEALGGFDPRSIYDEAARDYEDASRDFWQYISLGTVERLDLQPGQRVLDVPCGHGPSVVAAAQRVGPGGLVLGVDYAEQMVAIAGAKVRSAGLANVELSVGGDVTVETVDDRLPLRSPGDWWRIVMGSGFRRTVMALDPSTADEVRRRCHAYIVEKGVAEIVNRARYCLSRPPRPGGHPDPGASR